MGFLDNLLKKETRKIISSVVDSVVDGVKGAVQGNNADTTPCSAPTASVEVAAGKKNRENETGDDANCCSDINVVRQRIEMVAAENYPGYELRRDIPATELGADKKDRSFDYGLYLDGQPKVMIMVLKQYQYRNECVERSHYACKRQGVGSFHLLLHLPNRKTYIAKRLSAVMPS